MACVPVRDSFRMFNSCVAYEILPRHFVQTAVKSCAPTSIVASILDELPQTEGSHGRAAVRLSLTRTHL